MRRFASADFDARDRAFLRDLIFGVLRWRNRLDFVFGHFLAKPGLPPPVREALRLGTYQLLFMDRVPSHSAVDDSVSLLNRQNLRWARGLVNAVLRKVAARDVPPPEHPEDYLSIWESHPEWLVRRWMRALGEDEARRRCEANNLEAPVVFRVNTKAVSLHRLMSQLEGEGVATQAGCVDPDCLIFLPDKSVPGVRFSDTVAYGAGAFIVMDEASSLVSRFAGPVAGERVLDVCAAPGGENDLSRLGGGVWGERRGGGPGVSSPRASRRELRQSPGGRKNFCAWTEGGRLFIRNLTWFLWMRHAVGWAY